MEFGVSASYAMGRLPRMASIVPAPATRGPMFSFEAGYYNRGRLDTDSIGTTTVTFSGVPADSEIRVYDPDRNELAGIETCAANQVLSWAVYAAGSANNTVRIVIIDMTHRIKEFTYTSLVGNQSIPVQAEPDKWYANPI